MCLELRKGVWDFKGVEDTSGGDGNSMCLVNKCFSQHVEKSFLLEAKLPLVIAPFLVLAPCLNSFRQSSGR